MDKNNKNWSFLIFEATSFGTIIFGVLGFLIWNIYLARLGFVEYEIIQTRFILTGAMFFIFVSVIITIVYFLVSFIQVIFKKINFEQCSLFNFLKNNKDFVIVLIIVLLFFIYIIFPYIPSWAGGGSPRLLAFVMSEEEINNLASLGIEKPSGSSIQTQNFCIVYESNNKVIILLEDRILELKKDYIKGFISLPSIEKPKVEDYYCREILNSYLFPRGRSMFPMKN